MCACVCVSVCVCVYDLSLTRAHTHTHTHILSLSLTHTHTSGVPVVSNGGLHGPVKKRGSMRLNHGFHFVTVQFFENGGGAMLKLSYKGPDTDGKGVLQCVLQCVAVCCSVVQCVAVCCSVSQCSVV